MALVLTIAYMIGSVPFAWILARGWGAADLRRVGSGNVGAANAFRAAGITPGIIAAVLDAAKGALTVLIAQRLNGPPVFSAAAGLAAIVGHVYPVWLGFHGGKGVATAWGAFALLAPMAAAPVFTLFLVVVWLTRYISLGSVIATTALPPIAYFTGSSPGVVLRRLRNGTETRLVLDRAREGPR
jgi:glycerol-3-phosphate acyltransferase PlsY